MAIDDAAPFIVKTDGSDHTISATFNKLGHPFPFFQNSFKIRATPLCCGARSIHHCQGFVKMDALSFGASFSADYRQNIYCLNVQQQGVDKIKNEKIMRRHMQLSCYSYYIMYQPAKHNAAADTMTCIYCSVANSDSLHEIHDSLCHPDIMIMIHLV